MCKFTKKDHEVVYGIINEDVGPRALANRKGIKPVTFQMRLTRLKKRNGYKTSQKFFYELGRRDANLSK